MAVCRVCLVGNIGMQNIDDIHLLETYEKLTNTKLNSETGKLGIPSTVCSACHRQLQKCHRFTDMAHKSNKILYYLLQNGTEVTHNTVTMLPLETIQSITGTDTHYTSVNDYPYERSSPLTVKHEPLVVIHEPNQNNDVIHVKLEMIDENDGDNLNATDQIQGNDDAETEINFMYPRVSSDVCDATYNLVNDVNFHTGVMSGSCNVFEKVFTQSIATKPLRNNSGQKPYSCTLCEKTYTEKSSLTRHMQVHTGIKPPSCNKCSEVFPDKERLLSHMQIHADKDYFCKVCEKNFFDKCNLRRHMRVHTGERPYSCKQCDKAFTVKGHLIAHMRIHTGERPYACNLCDKSFAENCNLRRHMLLHTGERPFSCNSCAKTFTEKITLTRHLRIHTGLKPYFCQKCDKTFSYNHNLKKHVNRMHSKKAVKCEEDPCPESSTEKQVPIKTRYSLKK